MPDDTVMNKRAVFAHAAAIVAGLARFQFLLRYRNAMLGYVWAVGDQLLFLLVLSIVFSTLNGQALATYVLYVFSGLIPWRFLEESSLSAMESVTGGAWLLTQMPVSPLVFPAVQTMVSLGDLCCGILAGALIFLFVGFNAVPAMAVLPLAALVWIACSFGLGCLFAAAYTFVRDVKPIVRSLMMLLFFSSPILNIPSNFPADSLLVRIWAWHPVTPLAHLFQCPLYYKTLPSAQDWVSAIGIAVLCLATGLTALFAGRRKLYFYL